MKKLIRNSSLILLALVALVSCETKVKKDEITPNNGATYQSKVEKFFRENAVDSQQFVFNASSGTTLVGDEGTIISVPAYAFEYGNGDPVTGNVTINIKEIFDKGDMVFSGVTTQSNGQMLISGGEIFISAFSNGQEIFLNDSSTIQIKVDIETTPDSNMDLFVGDIDTSGNVNWIPADTSNFFIQSDSTQQNFYYVFNISNFGWFNCDYFYNQANTNLSVVLPSLEDLNATKVKQSGSFVIYKNMNIVTRLYDNFNCQGTNCPAASFQGSSGLNEEVIILTVADIDGKLHYNKQEVTITSGLTITLEKSDLVQVSDEQLHAIIDAF